MEIPRPLGYLSGAFLRIAHPLRTKPRDLAPEALTLGGLPPLFVFPAMLLTTFAEELTRASAVLLLAAEQLRLLPSLLGRLALALGLCRLPPVALERTCHCSTS